MTRPRPHFSPTEAVGVKSGMVDSHTCDYKNRTHKRLFIANTDRARVDETKLC